MPITKADKRNHRVIARREHYTDEEGVTQKDLQGMTLVVEFDLIDEEGRKITDTRKLDGWTFLTKPEQNELNRLYKKQLQRAVDNA